MGRVTWGRRPPPTARAGNAPGVAEQQKDGKCTAYPAMIRGPGSSRAPCVGPVMANPIRTAAAPRPYSTRKILLDKQLEPCNLPVLLLPPHSPPPSSPGAAPARDTPKMTSVAASQVAREVGRVYDPQHDEGPYARPSLVGFGVHATPNLTRDGRCSCRVSVLGVPLLNRGLPGQGEAPGGLGRSGIRLYRLKHTVLGSVISWRAKRMPSRPSPELLMPPKGMESMR